MSTQLGFVLMPATTAADFPANLSLDGDASGWALK